MTAPKGFSGIRTVTLPLVIWRYWTVLAFAGLVSLMLMAAGCVYFGVVLASRPDVPLMAPEKASTVTHPKEIKP